MLFFLERSCNLFIFVLTSSLAKSISVPIYDMQRSRLSLANAVEIEKKKKKKEDAVISTLSRLLLDDTALFTLVQEPSMTYAA